jgi:hypothetical protein
VINKCEVECTPFLSLLCPWRLEGLRAGQPAWISGKGKIKWWISFGVRFEAVARQLQQWGCIFFVVRSEADNGRGWSRLLFAFRKPPRKRQYIGQVNPNCERMKWVPGVKGSGREAEIQRVFLSLQCPLRLGGLRAGHPGLDSWQGLDVSPLHNVQTGFGINPASYQMSTGGSFTGGKNLCKLQFLLY